MIDNLQREREKAQVEIEKLMRENTMKLVLKEQTKVSAFNFPSIVCVH